jgi:hypothetical protein
MARLCAWLTGGMATSNDVKGKKWGVYSVPDKTRIAPYADQYDFQSPGCSARIAAAWATPCAR